MRLELLGKLKNATSSGTRTGDRPACSIVPQATTLPRVPLIYEVHRFDVLTWNGTHIMFHEDSLGNSSNIKVIT
jgi:hypothetical protein